MRYLITHETTLTFPTPVREHHCELRLVPLSDHRQKCIDSQIEILDPASGTRRAVPGTSGAPLYPSGKNAFTEKSQSTYSAVILRVRKGNVDAKAYDPDGTVIDSWTITK